MELSLQSKRLLIRPHDVRDIDELLTAVLESTSELSPWLPWCHPAFSKDELVAFMNISRKAWADGSQHQFAIFDAATGLALGGIGLNHIAKSNRLANMGYWVRTSATGRGVASEAAKLVAAYGFRNLGLSRIEIAAIPGNAASRRVAEHAGAKFEAVVRNRLVMHGRPYDAALYSLVPGDLVS